MKGLYRFCFFVGLFVILLAFLPAVAQVDYSTATLRGTIMDPQGAVIPGATVTVTNPSNGVTQTVKALADGSYRIAALPPGVYQINVEAPGFAKEVAKGIELTVGQIFIYDAHMKVGNAVETVEVSTDNVPLIQTEQTQQANTISSLQVQELPNLAHNITQQVYTLPGVSNSDAPRSQNPGFTGFFTTGFSIGGSNGRNNLSTIDGGENEYGTGQYRVTTIPQDTIQEYQVNRNAFAAEFGFTDGAAINIVTKSGGNQYHGSAYGYFDNHNTDAQNFFNGIEGLAPPYSQNLYAGFTVGGPIKKDKLFFFLGYEYRDLNNPDFTNANILSAPTVTGPSAAQTAYENALLASGNPFLQGFALGIKPGLSPLNDPQLNQILTAENGVFTAPDRFQNVLMRFDATPNPNNSLNLRLEYSHNNNGDLNPDASSLFTRDFSILGTWNHTFSPSVLNQVLVQIVPRNVANNLPNPPFQGTNFSLGALNVGALGGTSTFGSPALIPYKAHQQRYQFEDNVSWTHGSHNFKFGASARLANYTVEDDLWFNPSFTFADGAIPLIDLAPAAVQTQLAIFNLTQGFPVTGPTNTNLSAPQSFAFGLPAAVIAGFNNPVWTGWGKYIGSYAQDSWKVNSRLTVNAGVRFDVDDEPFPIGENPYVSPRLGLAWDAFGDHKTVVRAGGGLFVAPVDVLIPSYGQLLNGTGQYINEVLSILSPTNVAPAALWQIGIATGTLPFGHLTPADFAAVGINTTTPGASVAYGISPNYKNPYTVQGSMSIDHQFGNNYSLELGYNVYHGVHLQMPLETGYQQINAGNPLCALITQFGGNAATCTDQLGGPLYAPTSGQFQHTTYESIGSSMYNAATVSFTRRFNQGLQFQVNYTWSKTLDNVIDFASFDNWYRPNDLASDYTTSVFDIPQILVANAVYTTPFKTGSGNFLKNALADISVAPIETWQSGLPFSIWTPSVVNKINNQTLDNNFATPFAVSRDSLRGPSYGTTDASLTKSFFINRDRGVKLNLIAQGTNLFNRVNFDRVSNDFSVGGIPSVSPTCPVNTCANIVQTADGPLNLATGPFTGLHGVKPSNPSQITQPLFFSAANLPRQLQFALKLVF